MFENMAIVMESIKKSIDPTKNIEFTQIRDVKSVAYIVLTSDRGLCGSFNTNVSKEASALIESNKDKNEHILAIGTKGYEYFRRKEKNVIFRGSAPSETTSFIDAELLGRKIADMYRAGEVDEVYIVYTHFESILSHTPYTAKLLPINTDITEEDDDDSIYAPVEMTFDPDPKTFFEDAVPMYLNTIIYGAMMESTVCELASRMTSMDSATRNATEIIDDLTLEYNRKRQGMITQEITEIVTGANALN